MKFSSIAQELDQRTFLFWKRLRAARSGVRRVVIVAGVQRSGTNMLMEILEASPTTDVFHERDPRLYDDYHMRGDEVVERLVAASPHPVFIMKALLEPERVSGLMDRFGPARCFWVFRHFDDVVNSNMKSWPRGRNRLDQVMHDPANGGWRVGGMTAETLARLRGLYRSDLNNATAQAIFYWYRNKLLFDLGLVDDPRVMVIDYDRMVQEPASELPAIAATAGVPLTRRMLGIPHPHSIRKREAPDIAPEVRALCDEMYARLKSVAGARREGIAPAA